MMWKNPGHEFDAIEKELRERNGKRYEGNPGIYRGNAG